MKLKFMVAVMAAFAFVFSACDSKDAGNKQLVLYYSQTGSTKVVAEEIQKMLDADIELIELENPYTGTYAETLERVKLERESGNLPALKPLKVDLSKYEVIYLGYPIWFGTYALPIASLIKDHDFEGKKIVTFCTFGSGDLESALEDLKKALPKTEIAEHGFGIRDVRVAASGKELNRFLIEYGYMDGQVEALPGYSEMRPVMEEEKQIFEAACGDYQYPLGTPILVGKRGTPEGVDYIYEVENYGKRNTVFVTVGHEEGAKPEFTRVVR